MCSASTWEAGKLQYLDAMGIQAWQLRSTAQTDVAEETLAVSVAPVAAAEIPERPDVSLRADSQHLFTIFNNLILNATGRAEQGRAHGQQWRR